MKLHGGLANLNVIPVEVCELRTESQTKDLKALFAIGCLLTL